jgi:hypothetical protein
MDTEKMLIITTKRDLNEAVNEAVKSCLGNTKQPEFEDDRISKTKAAKLANMSAPTFNQRVKDGVFKQHGNGRKMFFLKSEVIEALKNSNH